MEIGLDEKQDAMDELVTQKENLIKRQEAMQNLINNLEQKINSMTLDISDSQTDSSNESVIIRPEEQYKLEEIEKSLEEEKEKSAELASKLSEKDNEVINLSNDISVIRNELNDKNRIIAELNKLCDEKERDLGEYRTRLSEARQRGEWLEKELENTKNDVDTKLGEIESLKKLLDEKDSEIEALNIEIAETPTVSAERELSPSDEELKMLQEKLRSAEERAESLEEQLDDLRTQRDYLQQQVEATAYRATASHLGSEVSPGIETSMLAEVDDVTEQLIKASKKVYEKEELLKEREMKLEASIERCRQLEEEKCKMGEELWLAKERVANQDRELSHIHGQLDWERGENERLRHSVEEEKRRLVETGGVDWSKFEALKNQMKEQEARLLDEKSKVEWHLGEVKQWWNDAKWRIGELEADISHRQWLLDQANEKAYKLEEESNALRQFRDMAKDKLSGTFLIRKQPIGERTKWTLAMWSDNASPDDLQRYRRVWFEIAAPGAQTVTLSASFVNWECALICDKVDADKFGVWVDIPPGRYEFCFLVDGKWTICDQYPTIANEFGTQNNWRFIE